MLWMPLISACNNGRSPCSLRNSTCSAVLTRQGGKTLTINQRYRRQCVRHTWGHNWFQVLNLTASSYPCRFGAPTTLHRVRARVKPTLKGYLHMEPSMEQMLPLYEFVLSRPITVTSTWPILDSMDTQQEFSRQR
jgi:hypothetical protein